MREGERKEVCPARIGQIRRIQAGCVVAPASCWQTSTRPPPQAILSSRQFLDQPAFFRHPVRGTGLQKTVGDGNVAAAL